MMIMQLRGGWSRPDKNEKNILINLPEEKESLGNLLTSDRKKMMISQLRGLSRPERWRGWQSANFLWPMAISMSNCLPQSTLWKVLNSKFQVRCKIDVFEAKKNKIRNELFVTSLYKLFLSLLRQYFPLTILILISIKSFLNFTSKGLFISLGDLA